MYRKKSLMWGWIGVIVGSALLAYGIVGIVRLFI